MKNTLIHSVVAGLFSLGVCFAYNGVYKQIADFTEKTSLINLLAYSLVICLAAGFINFALDAVMKNNKMASFIASLLISGITIGLVFYVLKMDDPKFKNEDAEIMKDFYKGYLMPIVFFPALSWLAFKPLFTKEKWKSSLI